MARTPADPEAMLARIAAARSETAKGEMLSATPMAKAIGYSWVNLRAWADSDPTFPVAKRGGEGVKYEFDAHAVFDYLERVCEAEPAKRRAEKQKPGRLGGLDDELVDSNLTLEQSRIVNTLQRDAQRRKIEQGHFYRKADVDDFLTEHLVMLQEEVGGVGAAIDPAGQLDPAHRSLIDNYMRNLLVRIFDRMEPWVGDVESADRLGAGVRSPSR